MTKNSYKWVAAGDVNAFFGLMLDNIAGLVLMVTLLVGPFQFPVEFALAYMVPGTAIGVLVGDLLFFWQSFRYAKKTGKSNVTAMPLGLDTPSTIGMTLLVVGPAYKAALGEGLDTDAAAMQAWHIGICALVIMGVIKGVLAFCSNWIHKVFPRAGLLGSLAAIALVLIAFNQLPELVASPIVGFASLAIVLVTLIARNHLPFKIPGALGAVLIGCVIWYLLVGIEMAAGVELVKQNAMGSVSWFPTGWLEAFRFEWVGAFSDTMGYLGYIIPFAVATVIGGIDCAESAASVGDEFNTRDVIGIEAGATVLAAVCGGVIQTTPYIGHPAYKAMGGRAAYTLATALFVGGAGLIGYFSLLFAVLPKTAVLPILIFIGLEITAASFLVTPRRHFGALAVAFLPAIAKLVSIILIDRYGDVLDFSRVPDFLAEELINLKAYIGVLAGGFILTSLIWASATAKMIDRKFGSAAIYFAIGGVLTMFGFMHSPLPGDKTFFPWQIKDAVFDGLPRKLVIEFAIAYLVMAVLMFLMGWLTTQTPVETDEDFEKLL